ncbi:hypothetical protein M1432_02750 [Patescibacteria group bacterium]|nr:hypothetical protein [Patescibacteria group bacterium]
MRNVNKWLLTVVVVLVVALIAVLAWQFYFKTPTYTAVYLRTGDLYFGELTTFPSYGLSHVYMLQVNSQDQKNPVSIQRFANVFWGPEDAMSINPSEVVWSANLDPQGQLAQLIQTNPNLVPPAGSQNQASATGINPSASNATSTSGK